MEIFRNGLFLFLFFFPGTMPIETISRGDEKMLVESSIDTRHSASVSFTRRNRIVRSKDDSTILDMKNRLICEQLFGITFTVISVLLLFVVTFVIFDFSFD